MPEHKINPALPYTELTIGETTYKLACTHRGLRLAEEMLEKKGIFANLLVAKLTRYSLRSTSVLFAAALVPFQPEMDFEAAQDLITDENLSEVLDALDATRAKSLPDPDPDDARDPPQPEQS